MSAYQNEHDVTGEMKSRGDEFEARGTQVIQKYLEQHGCIILDIIEANKDQQMKEHWDRKFIYEYCGEENRTYFELKSRKISDGNDALTIETKGKFIYPGWLYGSRAQYIVHDLADKSVIWYDPKEMGQLIKSKNHFSRPIHYGDNGAIAVNTPFYDQFIRSQKQQGSHRDISTRVPLSDIMQLKSFRTLT
jgi:hypothetical protein